MLKFEPQAARLCDLTPHGRLRGYKLRLRRIDRSLFDRDLDAIRFRVELNEDVANFDARLIRLRAALDTLLPQQ